MSDLANNLIKMLDMDESIIIPTVTDEETSNVPAVQTDHTKESDIEYARNNIRDIIEDTKMSIKELGQIAKDAESPRAYEVLSQFIQTYAELNRDLIDSYPEVKEKDLPRLPTGNTNIDKAVFFGSTADMQELIKKSILQNANDISQQSQSQGSGS